MLKSSPRKKKAIKARLLVARSHIPVPDCLIIIMLLVTLTTNIHLPPPVIRTLASELTTLFEEVVRLPRAYVQAQVQPGSNFAFGGDMIEAACAVGRQG